MNEAEVTDLLKRSDTDPKAQEAVFSMVYEDLRGLAGHRIATSRPGETLSVTSLVNEAYIKLTERTGNRWNDRTHFLRVAATAMRQITIDYVRAKLSKKRGGGQPPLRLESLQVAASQKSALILALEEGLQNLAAEDSRLVAVVECRFFAGFSIAETAEALGCSNRTVVREWDRARTWLKDYLTTPIEN